MSIIKRISPLLNLDKYKTFIKDTDPNSLYLKINEFKDVLTGGKNGFVIEGTSYLRETTEVKIEIKDVAGNTIYVEPGDGTPEYYEGLSKVISIHIYDDTPIGEGLVTILAELKEYIDDDGVLRSVPDEWKGVYNLKWQKRITINRNFANEDTVRFNRRPIVEIDEIVKPVYNINLPSLTVTGEVSGIAELPPAGTNINNYGGGTIYRLQLSSGSWDDAVDQNVISIPSLNYDTTVLEVLNDRVVLVDRPHTINGVVNNFISQSFTTTFDDIDQQEFLETNIISSYAKFRIQRLNTFVGDVARVKIYRKSRNTLEDFQFVQDITLEATEFLVDYLADTANELYYGNFYGNNLNLYWISGSDDHPIETNTNILANSVRVNYQSQIGGVQKLITSESFNFTEGVEYEISHNLLYRGGRSETANVKTFLSSSTFLQEINTTTFSTDLIQRTKISINFIADKTDSAKLVFEFVGDTTDTITPSPEWYISAISLKSAAQSAFSPDEITFIQPIPRKLSEEIFDFRFDFYDINNNFIPINVIATKLFAGGNDIPGFGLKLLTLETDLQSFKFDELGIPNPINQQISFTINKIGSYSGSLTFISSAFDGNGNELSSESYAGEQYPGLLTDVTDVSAILTSANFTGSRNDITVTSVRYTATIDDSTALQSIVRIADGSDGEPGLTVVPTVEGFSLPANSIGSVQVSLTDRTGSVLVRRASEAITFDNTLSENTFRFTVTGSNVTPISTTPTTNQYGITALSTDSGELTLNVQYKNPLGEITDTQRVVVYNKVRINAPLVTLSTSPKPISVSADSSGVQTGIIPNVSVIAFENYTGSIQQRPLTFLTSTSESLNTTPTYNAGQGIIGFDGVTVNSDISDVILSVTASFLDAEGTSHTLFDTLPISKISAGPSGSDGQDGADGADGQDGADGADGAVGGDGPGIVFRGPWSSATTYNSISQNSTRKDSVLYEGVYYATLSNATANLNRRPDLDLNVGTFWESLGTGDFFVAAKIAIFEESFIQNTLNIGTNTSGNANITISGGTTSPFISLGQTVQGFNNNGIFIGNSTGQKLSLKSSTNSLTWDGCDLNICGGGTFTGALSGGTISIGSGSCIFKADPNGIYLGNATFSSAPFRVTPAGALTSVSGNIGGFTINQCCLSGGSGSTTIGLIPGTGIHLGNATFDSSPFRVTKAGALTSVSGNIGGWTIASESLSNTVGGLSVAICSSTGAVTAGSGFGCPGFTLSPNAFYWFGAGGSNNFIRATTDTVAMSSGVTASGHGGVNMGVTGTSINGAQITVCANNDVDIRSVSGGVTISGSNRIDIKKGNNEIVFTNNNLTFCASSYNFRSGSVSLDSNLSFCLQNGHVLVGDGTNRTCSVSTASFGGGGSGTVTSITAGSGLSGGTITTSGTISLATTLTGLTSVTSTAFTGALTGNATTATTLQTARTIGGVSFNGSTNINLPGVNTAGNQNTSGNAATATTAGSLTSMNISQFTNNSGYITGIDSSAVTTALGFTPTSNTGTVTQVGGTGTVSGLSLSGNVTSTGNLTLGGTLSLTIGNVTTALGFTPYNATNPSGFTSNTGTVTGVTGTAPIASSGGTAPIISISAANTGAAGSMSSTDKIKLNGIADGATASTGTVTSVAALTLGTTGDDLNSTVSNGTTSPVITLNVPNASASARGVITTVAQAFGGVKTFGSNVCAQDFVLSSDIRLKSNIQPLTNSLDKLKHIQPYSYVKNGNPEIGIIAQEFMHISPLSVNPNEDGYLGISTNALPTILLGAVKELTEKVNCLECLLKMKRGD